MEKFLSLNLPNGTIGDKLYPKQVEENTVRTLNIEPGRGRSGVDSS